ncbi:MAG: hypothetical protein SV377_00130 [Halobacteria archaeon]|nr:hypothetical protein [Halobacteria archaeon]
MTKEFTPVDDETRDEVVGFWEEKFGVDPDVFESYDFYKKGKRRVWITSSEFPDGYEYEAMGLPFLRVRQEHPKPTTNALQLFGEHATKNIIELNAEDARDFVSGETVEKEFDVEDLGYVIVEYDGEVLGCGLYFPGELRSQIPKGRQVELNLPELQD